MGNPPRDSPRWWITHLQAGEGRGYAGGVDDLEAQAREILDPGAFGYFAGGAGDEIMLRENITAWSDVKLSPRVLVDVSERNLSVSVLGQEHAHPTFVAPMAYQKLAHPDGETAMARGAASTNSTMVLSSQSTTSPAEIALAVPDGRRWFQLYVFKDRSVSFDLVAQARDNGYEALVLTVDFPVAGWRQRDRRSGFKITEPVAVHRDGPALTTEEIFALHDPTLTWADIAEFAEAAQMPLILKGILHPDDARRAVDAGAAGVIVSNHGGRQLDTVLTGSQALPAIADAVGDQLSVLVDGGIQRGWDVAKALALGADAVLLGRRALWALATGGAEGVQVELERIIAEFDNTLALLGCPNARDLNAGFLA